MAVYHSAIDNVLLIISSDGTRYFLHSEALKKDITSEALILYTQS